MDIPAEVVEPEFTTEDAKALGIKKEVSKFTTYFPYAEYRNINIGRAAELVDGTIVRPGETFSLNGTVGERTAENGFVKGFVISNGIFKEDFGGGVSQMATTMFNAAFFAGMTDVQHKPHSFYIDRYPVGREATVAWPTVDLQWRNDTPYGVLDPRQRHAEHPLGAGRGDGAALLHEVLGHHDQDRRALRVHLARDPDPRHRGLLPQHRLRRVRHRHLALLAAGRLRRARAHREDAHHLHPLRHGDLQAAGLAAPTRASRGYALRSCRRAAPAWHDRSMGLLTEDPVPAGFTGTRIGRLQPLRGDLRDRADARGRRGHRDPRQRGGPALARLHLSQGRLDGRRPHRPRPAAPAAAPDRRGCTTRRGRRWAGTRPSTWSPTGWRRPSPSTAPTRWASTWATPTCTRSASPPTACRS